MGDLEKKEFKLESGNAKSGKDKRIKIRKYLVIFVIGIILVGFFSLMFFYMTGEKGTIKIVSSFPLRGVEFGKNSVKAIELALEEYDYMAGGYQIELLAEDDANEETLWIGDKEKEIAEMAVADEDVMVYLGPFDSGAAMLSIPITNNGGLVQISPLNTWPGLTQEGFFPGAPGIFYPTKVRNYFRIVPTDALQSPAAAIWAKELGAKNVYIFENGELYGTGLANLFEKAANEIGLNVVGREIIDETSQNLPQELGELENLDVDLVYVGGTAVTGGISLAKGIKETGLDIKLMGPDGLLDQVFIDRAGDAAEGAYITTVGLPASELPNLTEEGKEFYDSYKLRYGIEPDIRSALTYEAAKVALLAIERAGTKDRAKILEEISKIEDYDGLFGTWSFNENGDTTLSLVSGNRVKGGEFVFEKLLATK